MAKKGRGRVAPNPMVGCVIVRQGKVLSSGYHAKYGGPHAEINALKKIRFWASGATMYVTLEPCHHFGKTPPCVDAVIASGVRRVVIAMKDPNPKTNGKSVRKLKAAGIEVSLGVCEAEARELNKIFITNIEQCRPHVVVKVAQTLDGKIAFKRNQRSKITGKKSFDYVQKLRANIDAEVVGRGTVQIDNPKLNVRDRKKTQPMGDVMDAGLRVST